MVHVLDALMKAIASRSRLNLQNAFAYPIIYFTNYLWSITFSRNERLLYILKHGTNIIKCAVVVAFDLQGSHFNVEILFSIVILFISFNILTSFSSTTLLRSFLNFSSTLHSEYFKSSLLLLFLSISFSIYF